ncbi:hypothetical protein BO78DRAFT_447783 [Aspergillus sclerotiicarbonarius CBS 121057]|uniref:Uncharacterized protein n=1 Tax=Aspergillus sclerotiicarbonarius (strain CBS 121057 / IBT 28362) TaxID=1448318 RepID=A0A319FET6_ASPSB|nr:hypothetical protein BO78DRAFT_447783 [Aspergillus sclerotiicarbonarius CBS 121057]
MSTTALQGWHPGELAIQRKLGYSSAVSDSWSYIKNFMPEQHRIFHTSNLPFIPMTTIDEYGRPWASIVAGSTGEVGFVESPDPQTLSIHARLWDGDPLLNTVKTWLNPNHPQPTPPERFLTAGLGVEFSTRRRNKFAGRIKHVSAATNSHSDYRIDIAVTETLGNCPKYINTRTLTPHPTTNPTITHHHPHLPTPSSHRLPPEIITFIHTADTIFLATISTPNPNSTNSNTTNPTPQPPHAGLNARSGLPGFTRVLPSNPPTIILPDYSGNRFMSSVGNIHASGVAGLTILSFTTGDILYLTGTAEHHVGDSARRIMSRQGSLTVVEVSGYVFVRDAVPVREEPGSFVQRSLYSPRVRYLVGEMGGGGGGGEEGGGGGKAVLERGVKLAGDLAVFRFRVVENGKGKGVRVRAGQALVLDFMEWIGPPQYRHMSEDAPGEINDDRVRTWTVSSAHEGVEGVGVEGFELTMREMKGGVVTGALFNLLRSRELKPGGMVQFDASVCVDIVGTTGDFILGTGKLDVLWVAGGIGITPFLAMLRALAGRGGSVQGDVVLVLATREPRVMVGLVKEALGGMPLAVRVRVEVFTSSEGGFDVGGVVRPNVSVSVHKGRVGREYWRGVSKDKEVFVCGPGGFGDEVVEGLRGAGISPGQIHREGFY